MTREPEEILADLNSADVGKLTEGIRDLEAAMDSGADEFPLPPIEVSSLEPFGDKLPQDVQYRILRIVDGYQSFDPPQTEAERYGKIAILGSKWGSHKMALEAALVIKRAEDPMLAVRLALAELNDKTIASQRAREGAQYFISLLLDGNAEVRRATLNCLAAWPKQAPYRELVEYLVPQLENAELATLGH